SRYRRQVPIIALTPEAETLRRMALIWGVLPIETRDQRRIDTLAEATEKKLLTERLVKKGDVIGIVAGTPMGVRGTTNFMKFHVIGGAQKIFCNSASLTAISYFSTAKSSTILIIKFTPFSKAATGNRSPFPCIRFRSSSGRGNGTSPYAWTLCSRNWAESVPQVD